MKTLIKFIRKWYLTRQVRKTAFYSLAYGSVVTKKFNRKVFNPMRYILGKEGQHIVNPLKFYQDNQERF